MKFGFIVMNLEHDGIRLSDENQKDISRLKFLSRYNCTETKLILFRIFLIGVNNIFLKPKLYSK